MKAVPLRQQFHVEAISYRPSAISCNIGVFLLTAKGYGFHS
jgi:hypothetical protein